MLSHLKTSRQTNMAVMFKMASAESWGPYLHYSLKILRLEQFLSCSAFVTMLCY